MFEPLFKIHHFDFVLDGNLCDRDFHGLRSVRETRDPIVASLANY